MLNTFFSSQREIDRGWDLDYNAKPSGSNITIPQPTGLFALPDRDKIRKK
jgi:hypothetical protein